MGVVVIHILYSIQQQVKSSCLLGAQRKQVGVDNMGIRINKKHSELTKEKMSLAKLKNPVRYWQGKKMSKDLRKKLSEARKKGII